MTDIYNNKTTTTTSNDTLNKTVIIFWFLGLKTLATISKYLALDFHDFFYLAAAAYSAK